MAVTGWLESLRAAEKTALLQDGNSRSLASSLVLSHRVCACASGKAELEGRGRQPGQVLPRKLRPREMT